MSDLVQRAKAFALQATTRIDLRLKYTLQPYDAHLKAVAGVVASVTDDPETIAAAWLHDVVEDTPITFEEVSLDFGAGVAQLLMEVTDISRPSDGNRARRQEIDRRHLSQASPRAKTVKLADVIVICADIPRHARRLARRYVSELLLLLETLSDGNPTLYTRAESEIQKYAFKVENMPPPAAEDKDLDLFPQEAEIFRKHHGIRLFAEAFSARDILEPLLSFDEKGGVEEMREVCLRDGLLVAGIRKNGIVCGYRVAEDLVSTDAKTTRPILTRQTVTIEDPLSDVIHILTSFSYCFVTLDNSVVGIIGRSDIEKPVVRMWLFGIIIIVEMALVGLIRNRMPDGAWQSLISEERLKKAEHLYEERRRRNLRGDLLDCLQFSDKLQIAILRIAGLAELGFASASAARKVIAEMESLRNNLAHGQDITVTNWSQIARMSRRLHMLLQS